MTLTFALTKVSFPELLRSSSKTACHSIGFALTAPKRIDCSNQKVPAAFGIRYRHAPKASDARTERYKHPGGCLGTSENSSLQTHASILTFFDHKQKAARCRGLRPAVIFLADFKTPRTFRFKTPLTFRDPIKGNRLPQSGNPIQSQTKPGKTPLISCDSPANTNSHSSQGEPSRRSCNRGNGALTPQWHTEHSRRAKDSFPVLQLRGMADIDPAAHSSLQRRRGGRRDQSDPILTVLQSVNPFYIIPCPAVHQLHICPLVEHTAARPQFFDQCFSQNHILDIDQLRDSPARSSGHFGNGQNIVRNLTLHRKLLFSDSRKPLTILRRSVCVGPVYGATPMGSHTNRVEVARTKSLFIFIIAEHNSFVKSRN